MKGLGLILVLVGIVLLAAAAAQHVFGLSAISHLAIYLGGLGLIALLPGAWLFVRRSGTGSSAPPGAGAIAPSPMAPVEPAQPSQPPQLPAEPGEVHGTPVAAEALEAPIAAVVVEQEEAVLVVPNEAVPGEAPAPSAPVEDGEAAPG